MASVLNGQWEVTEVDGSHNTAHHHLAYLPTMNEKIEARFISKRGFLQLKMKVEGANQTKHYFPLPFAATTMYYLVENFAGDKALLDVVMIDQDNKAGKLVMQHDYYWSDQTHWTVNGENKLIKVGMSSLDVLKCVIARYHFANPGSKGNLKGVANDDADRVPPLWRCVDTVGIGG